MKRRPKTVFRARVAFVSSIYPVQENQSAIEQFTWFHEVLTDDQGTQRLPEVSPSSEHRLPSMGRHAAAPVRPGGSSIGSMVCLPNPRSAPHKSEVPPVRLGKHEQASVIKVTDHRKISPPSKTCLKPKTSRVRGLPSRPPTSDVWQSNETTSGGLHGKNRNI